jgi:hypothetical protein
MSRFHRDMGTLAVSLALLGCHPVGICCCCCRCCCRCRCRCRRCCCCCCRCRCRRRRRRRCCCRCRCCCCCSCCCRCCCCCRCPSPVVVAVALHLPLPVLRRHPERSEGSLYLSLSVSSRGSQPPEVTKNKQFTKTTPKIPSKIACQAPRSPNSIKINNIRIAKELFSTLYN